MDELMKVIRLLQEGIVMNQQILVELDIRIKVLEELEARREATKETK